MAFLKTQAQKQLEEIYKNQILSQPAPQYDDERIINPNKQQEALVDAYKQVIENSKDKMNNFTKEM